LGSDFVVGKEFAGEKRVMDLQTMHCPHNLEFFDATFYEHSNSVLKCKLS